MNPKHLNFPPAYEYRKYEENNLVTF